MTAGRGAQRGAFWAFAARSGALSPAEGARIHSERPPSTTPRRGAERGAFWNTLIAIACCAAAGCPKSDSPAAKATPRSSATPKTAAEPAVSAQKPETPQPEAAASSRPADPTKSSPRPRRSRQEEEDCVDRWLAKHDLDRYGHPRDTMYTGGTPLFNERTGETIDRLEYVYKRHPKARKACGTGGG